MPTRGSARHDIDLTYITGFHDEKWAYFFLVELDTDAHLDIALAALGCSTLGQSSAVPGFGPGPPRKFWASCWGCGYTVCVGARLWLAGNYRSVDRRAAYQAYSDPPSQTQVHHTNANASKSFQSHSDDFSRRLITSWFSLLKQVWTS